MPKLSLKFSIGCRLVSLHCMYTYIYVCVGFILQIPYSLCDKILDRSNSLRNSSVFLPTPIPIPGLFFWNLLDSAHTPVASFDHNQLLIQEHKSSQNLSQFVICGDAISFIVPRLCPWVDRLWLSFSSSRWMTVQVGGWWAALLLLVT